MGVLFHMHDKYIIESDWQSRKINQTVFSTYLLELPQFSESALGLQELELTVVHHGVVNIVEPSMQIHHHHWQLCHSDSFKVFHNIITFTDLTSVCSCASACLRAQVKSQETHGRNSHVIKQVISINTLQWTMC